MRLFVSVVSVWLLALSGATTAPAEPLSAKIKSVGSAANAESPLGTNISGIVDYSNEWAFVDLFKQSRDWISASGAAWDDGVPLDVDDNGWVRSLLPGQIARTLLLWTEGRPTYRSGRYLVTYEGEGDLEVGTQKVIYAEPGRILVWADARKGGILLNITSTKPDNYIRDIRVTWAGDGPCTGEAPKVCAGVVNCEGGRCLPPKAEIEASRQQLFSPVFLDSLRQFRIIRFMDWMDTNGSKIKTYAQRPKVSDARYSVKGVPVEVMVQLANELKADPWFTMPHLADDDYVRQFAEYVRDHLAPDRIVYIEYSNEVWNGIFEQAHFAWEQGHVLTLSSNDFEAQMRYYSHRTVEVLKIWEKVFGGTSRLVRVMGSQAANPWVSETVLGYQDAYRSVDALAIAPYFGGGFGVPENEAHVQALTPEQLIGEIRSKSLPEVKDWVERQKAMADKFGVALVAYEGGQHLVGIANVVNNERVTSLFAATNRNPAMKDVYLDYLNMWRDAGGGAFVHFVNISGWSKWGCWGARESLYDPIAQNPKAEALESFIATHRTP